MVSCTIISNYRVEAAGEQNGEVLSENRGFSVVIDIVTLEEPALLLA